MSDLKGMQIRVPVKESGDEIKALGGTAVSMPLTDLTTALQKNTVNGCAMQLYSMEAYKIADIAKYCTLISLYAPPDFAVNMNWNSYNSLSADLKKVIDDSLDWIRGENIKAFTEADIHGKAYAESKGVQFINLTPQEKERWVSLVINVVQQNQAAALDAKGYPYTEVVKLIKAKIAEYVK
jgi:TRAP-type transport system periplasmic protein